MSDDFETAVAGKEYRAHALPSVLAARRRT
jgi:hypothetical protein